MTPARSPDRPRHQPTQVGALVAEAMHRMSEERRHAAVVDYPTWKQIVGVMAARETQPTSLRQGRLTVRARDSAALYELSLRGPEVLAALRQALPQRDILDVRCTIGEITW